MVYVGLTVWMLLSAVLCFGNRFSVNKNEKIFLALVFSFSLMIMGVRGDSVGIDTSAYKGKFDIIANMDVTEILSDFYVSSLEFGYALLMKTCSLFIDNYFFFQIVYAVIFAVLSARFLYENADNLFIAVVVFFGIGVYAISFNVSRQMLAVMLVANSWTDLCKGSYFKAACLIVIASTMHITAVVFLCAFLLYALRNRNGIYKFCVIALTLFAVFFDKILSIVAEIMPIYHGYFINEKGAQSAGFVWIIWVIVAAMAIVIIYKRKHITGEFTEHSMTAVFSLVWFVCNIVGLYFNYFERVGYYFMPFVAILFSQFEGYIRQESLRRLFKVGVCVAFLLYFLLSTWGSEQYAYTTFY